MGIVRLLIEKGVDMNAKDNEGTTPLDTAIAEGIALIVTLKHKHKQSFDFNSFAIQAISKSLDFSSKMG